MNASYARQVQVALLVLLTVTFLGGWNMLGGTGTWIAPAQADDSQYDKDHDKDYDKNDYDHLACYEVKCIDRYDKDGRKVTHCDSEEERVQLFNQFTDDKDKKDGKHYKDREGQKVIVGELKLLCVPTKKVEMDHKDYEHKDYEHKD
jgi:hypothetical protein